MEAIFAKKNRLNYGRYWSDDSPQEDSTQSAKIERSPLKRIGKTPKKEAYGILFDDVFAEARKKVLKCSFENVGQFDYVPLFVV